VVRSMEYVFPHQGFAENADQFMLGDKYLVAPVLSRENARTVVFPKGRWRSEHGRIIKGPAKKRFDVPIDQLLWFESVK
ncbi:MAG TPA: glycoside hydrolase, partial [Flavisolibacter sp.]|nr:glycoside hydrolase [Flavisolibacter sp.]